ncbi:MAG: hemolysin family protein [Thermodesulfobacteriota bacterium]
MLFNLIFAVGVAVGVSFFCSLAEAALYSVPWSRIEQLRKEGKSSGTILYALRHNIDRPITAILTLNTVANTAGAAVAGAAAAEVFGHEHLVLFTAAFTVVILVFSEIVPKSLGVMYTRTVAPMLARPLRILVSLMMPAIWVLGLLPRLLHRRKKTGHSLTEEDIRAIVSLTRKSGVLKPYEEHAISNILSLDLKRVEDIMTPRTVVFSLPAVTTVAGARAHRAFWHHGRIPVYAGDDPEDVVGIVYRRDVLDALAQDRDAQTMAEIMHPARFVLETLTLDRLLIKFLGARTHLYVVLDEYGGVAGVVTLEDVLEEILGKEIVDETDVVADLRALARSRRDRLVGADEKSGAAPSAAPGKEEG